MTEQKFTEHFFCMCEGPWSVGPLFGWTCWTCLNQPLIIMGRLNRSLQKLCIITIMSLITRSSFSHALHCSSATAFGRQQSTVESTPGVHGKRG